MACVKLLDHFPERELRVDNGYTYYGLMTKQMTYTFNKKKIFSFTFCAHKKGTSHSVITTECQRNNNISRLVQSQIMVGER